MSKETKMEDLRLQQRTLPQMWSITLKEFDTESDNEDSSISSGWFWTMEEIEYLFIDDVYHEMSLEEFYDRCWYKCIEFVEESTFEAYWNSTLNVNRFQNFESSYVKGCKPDRYIRGLIVDYERCSPVELKRFVNDRRLKDPYPPGVTLKHFYLHLLQHADKKLVFRFMDLPPEMRVFVYRHLLKFPPAPGFDKLDDSLHSDTLWNSNHLTTGILRASKQVYTDARGVLYDDNVYTTSFSAKARNNEVVQKRAQVHNTVQKVRCAHDAYFRLPDGIDDYPSFFRHIAHLEIHLSYEICGTNVAGDDSLPLAQFVSTLASFLMDGHRLKSLRLKLDLSSEIEDWLYEVILYPLRRLRNIPKLTIEGYIPENVKRKVVQDLESIEPAFNTMRLWKLLLDEARSLVQLVQASHRVCTCSCGECEIAECLDDLRFKMYSISSDTPYFQSFAGSRCEEQLMARLAKLQKTLKRIDVDELQRLAKAVAQKQEVLNEYEAVTDDGRLNEAESIWEGKIYDDDVDFGGDSDWGDDGNSSGPTASKHLSTNMESVSTHPSPEV